MSSITKIQLDKNGYAITSSLYNSDEVGKIISMIEQINTDSESLIKTKNLFAIRQLIRTIPELKHLLFTDNLLKLISDLGGEDYFLTKAIYFDKPKESNWFVAYHQDISISVKEKHEIPSYSNWTFKKNQHGVIPPTQILNNIITLRIHLDHTTIENGALRVIPKSHLNGIVRIDSNQWKIQKEVLCEVEKGAVMLMKPLTFHASNRTYNNQQRRIIHLEFSNIELTKPLEWLEKMNIFES